jgi:hypothetical protein
MEVKDFSLCGKRMHSADASSMLPHRATLHVGCYDGDALYSYLLRDLAEA